MLALPTPHLPESDPMPLIEIKSLPPADPLDRSAVLARVNRAVADAAGLPIVAVWSVWTELEPGCYVEGERAASEQPTGTHPPIVRIVAYEGRRNDTVVAMLEAVAQVLGDALCDGEPNVFATYEEARSGRVFTGGRVRYTDSADIAPPAEA
ncbi:hypothetical protein [Engelhardtia mirabilis]|uniref:Tautomerase enzyme n=1 Tax=Engelhardtia mirabilis TaxID=2528011 RepID=A0A518BRR2_9BACT|nr:hypothetical protein Pla133_47860 [Planctomycetes bacterium Pla133]QDV03991.1 hypothetical protein Pla86_47840 [Planctomycetes bacterium Pla86]